MLSISRDSSISGNGLVNLNDFPLTYPTTPNMTVLIGAGTALVDGFRIANDTNVISLTVGVASMQPRIDIVQIGHDVNNAPSLVIKQGVPGTLPLEPDADAGYVKLYAISVGAYVVSITSANITDRRALVPPKVSRALPASDPLGTDIKLDPNGDLISTMSGSLDVVTQQDNVAQSVRTNLMTIPTMYLWGKNVGSSLASYIDQPITSAMEQEIKNLITEKVSRDPRIIQVLDVKIDDSQRDTLVITIVALVAAIGVVQIPIDVGR